ncbi:MAG: helix-turn-helix domain-containing protein [Actinomycetota bacterium]
MAVPLPGQQVRGSRTGRPIMALLDLLGRRWALRILWELRAQTLNFRELRERCDSMSPSVLNARLAELREAGVVELAVDGYRLTGDGDGLLEAFTPVSAWAKRWGRRMARSRMSA